MTAFGEKSVHSSPIKRPPFVSTGDVFADFAMPIFQCGTEGDGAAPVVVGLDADMPFAQRQTRLAALKILDLAFLVTKEHHRLLGRIEVRTDDTPKLRLKIRTGGKTRDMAMLRRL